MMYYLILRRTTVLVYYCCAVVLCCTIVLSYYRNMWYYRTIVVLSCESSATLSANQAKNETNLSNLKISTCVAKLGKLIRHGVQHRVDGRGDGATVA